jgi:hypothetical protein
MDSSTYRAPVAEKTKTTDNKSFAAVETALGDPHTVARPSRDTAERITMFVRGAAAHSTREIDALINDLESLREKLLVDSERIERDVVEFAALNRSVINLTEIISDGVSRAKAPSIVAD